ncbi:MAG: CorA family divalent cation transporter [Verrucomicrobiia bacterium]
MGLPPGTLVHTGEKKTEKVRLTVFDYDADRCTETEVHTAEETFPFQDRPTNVWINIDGLHQVDLIERIGQHYGLHPLLLEDVVSVRQRPKLDDYGSHLYIVLKMISHNEQRGDIDIKQVSLVPSARISSSLFRKTSATCLIPSATASATARAASARWARTISPTR